MVCLARRSGSVRYYPAGATTHSEQGVTDLSHPVLEVLEKCGMPLSVHGEVVDPEGSMSSTGKRPSSSGSVGLLGRFPVLKVVLEHITTREAVDFVLAGPLRLAATITS